MLRPMPDLVLHGERVTLRSGRPDDRDDIAAMLAEPDVARWWPTEDATQEAAELLAGDDDTTLLVVEVKGRFAGVVLLAEEEDPQYRHAGIDIALAPAFHDRGLGTDAVRAAARYLIEQRGHHRVTIDPAADNGRAIAAYAKVGFRPVGAMRRYERRADGTFHDGLLMDLLADELILEGAPDGPDREAAR
jgi:aminoglycoside 6'-N-acetyltransferase